MQISRNIIIITICALFLQSCFTSIKRIRKNQEKFEGKKVMIRGEIISSLELYELKCFTVKNSSGKILVVTDNLLPLKKDRVWVRGKVVRNFQYKGQNILVIKEKTMKLRKASGKSKNLDGKL